MLFVGGDFKVAGNISSPYVAYVNIDKSSNNPVTYNIKPFSTSTNIRFYLVNSLFHLININPHDRISLYSLSGRCVRQAEGVSAMKLTGVAPQPLFVRVSRAGKIVSTGMVMVQ